MSDTEKKDKELKKLTRDLLIRQVEESQKVISYTEQSIVQFQKQAEQQRGVLAYAQHLLAEFELPSEPKAEPKKADLEVK